MGGKLTSGGIKLPNTGEVEQTKVVVSVDGFEADETGNIDIGGSFDYTSKTTQVSGLRSLSRHSLRIYGIDDYLKRLQLNDSDLLLRDESLTISQLNGDYVYVAEENEYEDQSAYYRSDNGGLTYTREKLPISGTKVKNIRTSETGQYVVFTNSDNRVYFSSDYGKTLNELDDRPSESKIYHSDLVAISRDGSKIITAHIKDQSNKLKLWQNDLPSDIVLPNNHEVEDIVDIEVGNNGNIVLLTNNNYLEYYSGGWKPEIVNVSAFGVDGTVEKIYYGTESRDIFSITIGNSSGESKLDLDQEYPNNVFDTVRSKIYSIKVSSDGTKISALVLHNSHLENYGENDNIDAFPYWDNDGVNEDGVPEFENSLNGIIFSEDSGNNWTLSKIKGAGVTKSQVFLGDSGTQYDLPWRHVITDNFEKGFLAINSSRREMIKITPKSTAAINASKLIVDGGIVLGQSLEYDTLWMNRLPGTLEYEPYNEHFQLHFNENYMTIGKELNENISRSTTPTNVIGKPLTVVEAKVTPGQHFQTWNSNIKVLPSNIMKGMDEIDTSNLLSDKIEMPSYSGSTTPAKILEISRGEIKPSSINTSDISGIDERVEILENAEVLNLNYYDGSEDLLAGGVSETQFQINRNIETVSDITSIIPNSNFSSNAQNWTGYHYQQGTILSPLSLRTLNETNVHSGTTGWDDDPYRTYKLELTRYYYVQGTYTSINIPSHMVAGDTFRIMFDLAGYNTIGYNYHRHLKMYIISGSEPTTEVTRIKSYNERYTQNFTGSTVEGSNTFIFESPISFNSDEFRRNTISNEFTLTEDMVNSGKFYLAFESDPGYFSNYDQARDNRQWFLAGIGTQYNIDRIRFLEQDPSNTIDGDETTFWSGSTDGNLDAFGDGIQYNIQNAEVVKAISISPDPDTKRIEVYGTNAPTELSGGTDGYTYDKYFSSGWDKIGDLTTDSASFPDSQIYDSKSLISGTSRYNYTWVVNDNSNSYQYYTVKLTSVNNTPVKIYEVSLHPKLLTSEYEYHLISNDSADSVIFSKKPSTDLSSIEERVTTLEGSSQLFMLPTPVIFMNRDGVTTLADLPIVKKSDGTDSGWRRLRYSAISSEIPNGAALYCRGMGASGGYTTVSQFHINSDVSGSSDDPINFWEHGWLISYDAGASAGGGNYSGYSHTVKDGYLIPLQGINSNTNSILIHYHSGFQKLAVLGWIKIV